MTALHRFRLPSALAPLLATLPWATVHAQDRESIFDRVVRIEEELVLEIPRAPRHEERLGLEGRRVDVGDAMLYVEEEGSGTPLVLINGGPGGTHHYFHPWFGRATGYARVIYYDQRGTGLSDFEPGPDGYSVEQAVEDLDAVRRALEIDSWVLVGFSYGGFLAQYYATRYPESVAGLVLVGASPGMWADLGRSGQNDFLSEAELARKREIRAELSELRERERWSREKYIRLLVYNNHINGDWKRQHFYKPSPEKFAHIALYEWVQDVDFNSIMNQSMQKVDLSGAFEGNPIPTLILEGKWDLTWGPEKPTILSRNHPNARMVVIERAGHSIYNENPEVFFSELEEFVRRLPGVKAGQVDRYRQYLAGWRSAWQGSPLFHLKAAGWGMGGSRRLAEAYEVEWLEEIDDRVGFLRVGFALYDTGRYAEALRLFERLGEAAEAEGARDDLALALIWQGHMLDLLGRRRGAIARYQRVADMALDDGVRHDQYGLSYRFSPYAAERLRTPFQRIENRQP